VEVIKENLIETARKLYIEGGHSCSESVILALKNHGIDIPDAILKSVSGLRTGIGGRGCICGALMASVLVAGYLDKADISADLHDKFKNQFKSTCCRVLTRKYDFKSKERKVFCAGLVEFMICELQKILPHER